MRRRGSGRRLRFFRDKSAVAAVEFAFVAPIMIVLYMGGVDVTMAITLHRKLQHATSAIGDLISQASTLTKAEVIATFTVADRVLQPYKSSLFSIKVTSVIIDAAGNAKIDWSVAQGQAAGEKGKPFALPSGMTALRSTSLVMTESTYQFQPLSTIVGLRAIPMGAAVRGRFRGRETVSCSDC